MKKIAIVTGSRRGIGLATVKKLMSDVVEKEEVKDLLAELNRHGEADYFRCDISVPEDREALMDAVVEKYGRIDALVNNAGVACKQRLDILETTVESVERLLRINLEGTFFMCQAGAKRMIAMKKAGLPDYNPHIVNIASMSSYTSSVSRGEYCMSKAGISMVTKLFADRLAEENISVFEVRPGIIMTDMTAVVKEKYEKLIAEGVTPIRRFGQPEDVANCVSAACSGLLDFGTGTVLNADGGYHIPGLYA